MNAATLRAFVLRLRSRPLLAGGAIFVVLAAIGAMLLLASRSQSIPLFASPLDAAQIAETDARLAEWSVPHVVDGDRILVDAPSRNALLLRLSLAGLPHAHVSSSGETLAKLGALTPDALLAAQTREGLGGDLAIGLRGIDGVADASVVISPATPAAFDDQPGRDAGAAVRLSLKPGVTLGADAVAGIRAYVASAVAGLAPEHVTILDDRGIDLADASRRRDDAEAIRTALQSAFDDAFGAGSTIVRVHASYDERTRELRESSKNAAGPAILSQESDERLSADRKRYLRREASSNRGVVEHDERTVVPAGSVSRLSIAVLVDQARSVDVVKLRAIAAAASGIDLREAGEIVVEPMGFARVQSVVQSPFALLLGATAPALPATALATAAIVLAAFARRPIATALRAAGERASVRAARASVTGFAPLHVHGALSGEPPHTVAAVISALPAATAAAVLDLYPSEERREIVTRMARTASHYMPPVETLLRGA